MQDLRLIGVHEDGAHLLLAGADGERYRLPLDEALRAAARRDRPRLGQLQIEIEGGARPREVQAMIRAGLSPAEVAERSGWSLEKIGKYEGPILAEREHVAGLARAVRMRHRGSGSAGAPTLERRVAERLATRGVPADHLVWDSWRREGPEWTVVLTFPAGGRERQASWSLEVPTRTLTPRDDEARWLSEDEVAPAVVRDAPVYDIEADGGVEAAPAAAHPQRPVDLVTAMRERSGARGRRGSTRRRLQPVALPLDDEPETSPPAQVGDRPAEPAEDASAKDASAKDASAEDGVEEDESADPVDESPVDEDESADPVDERRVDEGPSDEAAPAEPGDAQPTAGPTPSRPPTRRTARTPVPSWDDIVFGATSRPTRDED